MQRHLVQIARIRMEEVVPGDIVNRQVDDPRGWFRVAIIEELFDGNISVSDSTRQASFSAMPLDIVGVQTLKPIDIPVSPLSDEELAKARETVLVSAGSSSEESA